MSKTGAGLAKWAKDIYNGGNHVYWYGTYCNPCTISRLAGKKEQYPSHYTAKRLSTYEKHIDEGRICTDCVGLIKGYYWELDGAIKYVRNGLPDKSAAGMYRAATIRGNIKDIPDIPGALVWTSSLDHVGVYVGNGYIIEARGFAYGIQKHKIENRNFTLWGLCPYIKYTDAEIAEAKKAMTGKNKTDDNKGVQTVTIELEQLKKGSKGDQVKTAQRLLNTLGHDCGEVDGDFGTKTANATKSFQKAHSLTVDAIIGKNTWEVLLK